MSKTTFNRQVRALHITRWPFRKRDSLRNLAATVEATLVSTPPLPLCGFGFVLAEGGLGAHRQFRWTS